MIEYDDSTDYITFSSGTRIYCFGGNPSIGFDTPETVNYNYGSDGGFSIIAEEQCNYGDISVDDAIELATTMIATWTAHKAYLLRRKANGSLK